MSPGPLTCSLWADDLPFIDGVAQFDRGVGEWGIQILERREACKQIRQRVMLSGDERARVVGLLILHQVHVPVDQARQHGRRAEVDHARARRNFHAVRGTHVRDPVALNHDYLIREVRSRARIEQAPGADSHSLGRRRLHRHARSVEWRRLRPRLRED